MITKLHHIKGGTMHPIGGKIFDRSLVELSCNCLLIETTEGLILVDTGIGTAAILHPRSMGPLRFILNFQPDPDKTALRQIENLGYSPGDVKHIILTHMDIEHTGGLADFPDARVHVHEAEYRSVMRPATISEHIRYRKSHYAHSPAWVTHSKISPEPWYGFDCIRDLEGLSREIILVPLPGHTRGHCGVAVETKDCWLLYTGDAYHFEQLVSDYSACPGRIRSLEFILHENSGAALGQIEKIAELVAASGDEVKICSALGSTEFKLIESLKLH